MQTFVPKTNVTRLPQHTSTRNAVAHHASQNTHGLLPAQAPIQAQSDLNITRPNDACEQEAHRMADQMLRMPQTPSRTYCPCDGCCPGCGEGKTDQQQSRPQSNVSTTRSLSPAEGIISSYSQPLSPSIRESMEYGFGQDFGQVKIHTDTQAAKSAKALNAKAFTTGDHIGFAPGEFHPHTQSGKRLLAHELSHVIQQQRDPAGSWHKGMVFREDASPPAEEELSHDDQVWQLIENYRSRSDSAYDTWDLAREDYRQISTEGGNPVLRDAEHYLFRYMLAFNLDNWVEIEDGLPVNMSSERNLTLYMNANVMQNYHDPIYNSIIRPILEEIIDIAPATPSMTEWEERGWQDGYCDAGRCNFREEVEEERREALNDYYSDPYVIMGLGGP
ncbi:DUF4157 domain-containing protein [bacterium]|nr:DUF4157 domain-containing protein [bacterium]